MQNNAVNYSFYRYTPHTCVQSTYHCYKVISLMLLLNKLSFEKKKNRILVFPITPDFVLDINFLVIKFHLIVHGIPTHLFSCMSHIKPQCSGEISAFLFNLNTNIGNRAIPVISPPTQGLASVIYA